MEGSKGNVMFYCCHYQFFLLMLRYIAFTILSEPPLMIQFNFQMSKSALSKRIAVCETIESSNEQGLTLM